MYNLTITIWTYFDENGPEIRSAGRQAFIDREMIKTGSGASPPDK